jgi:ABC-type polysaccharide/polyol phosphate transport system ATPase subunit
MQEIAERGATVIFVSHDFEAVRHFCRRAVWLDGGRVRADGPADDVVAALVEESARVAAPEGRAL